MLTGLERHRRESTELLLLVAILILTILTMWVLKKRQVRFLHETGGAMLYGFILGLILKLAATPWKRGTGEIHECVNLNTTPKFLLVNVTERIHEYYHVGEVTPNPQALPAGSILHKMAFNPEIFFNLLLPPIIFHGAYSLNQRQFFKNIGSVLTFALIGTLLTCGIIGFCMFGFVQLMVRLGHVVDGDFSLKDCLLFGSLMSATDPVTVLAIFTELHVDSDLYILLFGESVLNDAVAIVLTYTISSYDAATGGSAFHVGSFFLSAARFLGVFAGSFTMGLAYTVITALVTKFTQLRELPLLETGLFFLFSWSSFLSAEACGLSGIVAVLFCGITQARYTIHNLSSEAKVRTTQLFEFLNFLGENFTFCYIGLAMFTFHTHVFQVFFIFGAFLSIMLARACNIYPLSFLLNLGRHRRIPRNIQHMMMFSGLRGAVAFALAAQDTSTEAQRAILSTTLLVVLVTVWVMGSATVPMLGWLDIRVGVDPDENPGEAPCSQAAVEDSLAAPRPQGPLTWQLWKALDYRYLRPALTHEGPPLTTTLPLWCGPLARLLTSPHAYENQEQLGNADDSSSGKMDRAGGGQESPGEAEASTTQQDDLLEGDLGLGTHATPVWTD
uniref:Sodium/hydrogen exchanger n=1 Tax=Paramormyrops kingsleyae TaxID=1676925 RepID=A0A3B3SAS8_9TELE|nr:sodium/hydrogen exchanger 9-like [Paramormyrops kingsleyae]